MADIISKASDTEIKVTSEKVIPIRQLELNKKSLITQISRLQNQLDLINNRLVEADKLGIELSPR